MLIFLYFSLSVSYAPTDPEYPNQFYLHNNGKYLGQNEEDISIETAWNNGLFGDNAKICVIDDGCNYHHKDLEENFNLEHSWNYLTFENDPIPQKAEDNSGTINAGIIAAKENDIDIIGIANKAQISCFNLAEENRTKENLYDSISRDNDYFKVKLFGFPPKCSKTECIHEETDPILEDLLNKAPSTLIFVQPGGSDASIGSDTNFNSLTRSPRVIVVSDTTNKGTRSAWSNRGTNILISSPVGGSSSYDNILFPSFPGLKANNSIEGTEYADPRNKGAASVAGAIALLLEMRPDLSWRDVHCMLAVSSTIIDPIHPSWQQNKRHISYSHIYGFGRLNFDQLFHVRDVWNKLPEQVFSEGNNTEESILPTMRKGAIDRIIDIDDTVGTIEYVSLKIVLKCSDYSALRIQLFSPSNTMAYVKTPTIAKEHSGTRTAEFTIRNFLGESAKGQWKLHIVSDGVTTDEFFINASLKVTGCKEENLLDSYQNYGPNPYKSINYHKTAEIELETDTISCGVPFNVTIKTKEIPDDTALTFLLGDQTLNSQWPLLDRPMPPKNVSSLQIPCYFHYDSKMNLTVVNQKEELWGSKKITINNAVNQTMEMIIPAPYSIFKISQDGALDMTVMPRMDLRYWIDGAYSQRARIQLYDIDTQNVTYETDLSTINNIQLHIENVTKCPRCVLSFVPNWYSSFNDDCVNIIQPISVIGQFDTAPEPWILDLNDKCPIPSGIFTPTPTPSPSPSAKPTQTPTPRRTESPTPTIPGEGLKQNTAAIIVGSCFLGVFVIFLLIFLYVNRRKPDEGNNLLTKDNDFSYVDLSQ